TSLPTTSRMESPRRITRQVWPPRSGTSLSTSRDRGRPDDRDRSGGGTPWPRTASLTTLGSPQMSAAPQLLPTSANGGEAPGVGYRIEGELVPVLHVTLDGSRTIYFEHHVLLWKDPGCDIQMHP